MLLTWVVLQKMTIFNTINRFNKEAVSILNKKTAFKGFFSIERYHLKHRLFSGQWSNEFSRELFERGDAVVLIPYDPDTDQLLLIEQFRVGALRTEPSPWTLEFIAGMFGESESPIDVAVREAKEEANIEIKPERVRHVFDFLTSPGGTSEKIFLYVAAIDAKQVVNGYVAGLQEENEDIKSHLVTRKEALELLAQGRINNASTIIGLQWLAANYKNITF